KIRALVADVRGCLAVALVGPAPVEIVPRLPPSPSGLRTYGRPCPNRLRIFQRGRPRRNAGRRARAGCPSTLVLGLRALRRSVYAVAVESAQQAAVGRVLHQRVLEGIDCVGRRAALKYQFSINEARV